MSDTMQAPIGGELDQSSEGPGGNRRALIALAALAGALVIGAAVYFLFLSGDSNDDALAAVPQTQATVTQEAKGNNGDGDKAGDKVPEEFKGNVGRDPFAPLAFELETAEPVATEPVATEPVATDAPATDPTGVPTTDPQPTSGSPPATSAYVVEVKSVNVASGRATIDVNDKTYTVKTGDVFPSDTTGPFKILRLSKTDSGRGVAKVLFGSDLPVILKQGHPVTFGSF